MRVNRTQEFVIGGYTLGGRHFDALIFGYWEGGVHSGRARAVAPAVPGRETPECPFANLPEARAGRWGEDLTAEDERLPVAEADARGTVRGCGVDAGEALAAFAVCGAA